ncbi:PROTEIN DISULFIDE ISOMERASE, partial [Salix viminalis]
MPQFAEATTKLKELRSHVMMAKLDAERYPTAASTLGIKGFPTLLLFVNGTSQVYTGGFSGEDIVISAKERADVPVIKISSSVEAENFQKKYHLFVLGLFDKFE